MDDHSLMMPLCIAWVTASVRSFTSSSGRMLATWAAIGSFAGAPVKVKQEGTDQELADFYLQGVDAGYADTVTYRFAMVAEGCSTPEV